MDVNMDSSTTAGGASKWQPLQFDIGLYYRMIKLDIDVFWSFL